MKWFKTLCDPLVFWSWNSFCRNFVFQRETSKWNDETLFWFFLVLSRLNKTASVPQKQQNKRKRVGKKCEKALESAVEQRKNFLTCLEDLFELLSTAFTKDIFAPKQASFVYYIQTKHGKLNKHLFYLVFFRVSSILMNIPWW